MPPLLTALVPAPGRVVVRLTGDADVSTSAQLADVLTDAAALGVPSIVVDVAGARFWDVSGLHVLAAFTAALAPSGRQCRVVGANASTRRLVALADFTHSLRLDGPVAPDDVAPEPAPEGTAAADATQPRRRRFSCGFRRRAAPEPADTPQQDLSRTVDPHHWR